MNFLRLSPRLLRNLILLLPNTTNAEQMLETYIKFHITKMGYEPSEEQKLKKLEEYIKKKEN
jgi:hypothetical protein